MDGRTKRLLVTGLLVAGLGITGFLIAYFVGGQDDSSLGAQEGGVTLVPNLLEASNRSQLSLCVDGAGGLTIGDNELNAVRQALEDAIASVPQPPAEYSQRQVSAGCPPATALTLVGSDIAEGGRLDENDWTVGDVIIGSPGAPSAPSPHRLFVYFVTPEVYAASFAAEPYFRATAETIFRGDVGFGVTTALYVRSSASNDVLRAALLRLLNLVPPPDNPAVDEEFWRNCQLGTPDPWCGGWERDKTREAEQSQ